MRPPVYAATGRTRAGRRRPWSPPPHADGPAVCRRIERRRADQPVAPAGQGAERRHVVRCARRRRGTIMARIGFRLETAANPGLAPIVIATIRRLEKKGVIRPHASRRAGSKAIAPRRGGAGRRSRRPARSAANPRGPAAVLPLQVEAASPGSRLMGSGRAAAAARAACAARMSCSAIGVEPARIKISASQTGKTIMRC